MSWWTPSWFPTLPSIEFSLPSSIQKRFFSFGLRRVLGHFLKPGQLDTQQIDSQIGSGFVQVRDVELDNAAINALLVGLPLQLHDGSVGKVTARIPWPNPLTSVIGLSLESLHLTFVLTASPSQGRRHPSSSVLAESVASAAESFMHEELDASEEASLRDSVHSELEDSVFTMDNVPGGLDPFLSEEGSHVEGDPPGVSIFASLIERLLARLEVDSTDLKITLVHPGRASFTFTVASIRYRTNVNDTLPTDTAPGLQASPEHSATPFGVAHTVSISSVTVTSRCLRPLSPPPTASRASPTTSISTASPTAQEPQPSLRPSSPYSDSSDYDEDTNLLMSQSLATLPPRPLSPSSSVASSMYESAISTSPANQSRTMAREETRPYDPPGEITVDHGLRDAKTSARSQPALNIAVREIEDEMLLSFGHEPITIRLWTPSPARREPSNTHPSSRTRPPAAANVRRDVGAMKLDITIGVVAVALKARHIRSMLEIGDLWSSHPPVVSSRSNDSSQAGSSHSQRVDATLRLRGIVACLLPGKPPSDLAEYFNYPLAPPRLPHGFARLHLEELCAAVSVHPTSSSADIRPAAALYGGITVTARLSLSELSAFAFMYSPHHAGGTELAAIPLLITDPNLPYQYDGSHIYPDLRHADIEARLPAFDIVDWTDPVHWSSSARISAWRTRKQHAPSSPIPESPKSRLSSSPSNPRESTPTSRQSARTPSQPAVVVKLTITTAPLGRRGHRKGKDPENGLDIDVDISPLHVFLDASHILGDGSTSEHSEVLSFLDVLSSNTSEVTGSHHDEDNIEDEDEGDEETDTPPGTPRARQRQSNRRREREREEERRRLERLVLEDLELGFDYSQPAQAVKGGIRDVTPTRPSRKKASTKKTARVSMACKVPMVRLEVRAAPRTSRPPRSGAVVLDIHGLCVSSGKQANTAERGPRFADTADGDSQSPRAIEDSTAAALASAQWDRLVFAYSMVGGSKAKTVLSLGPLPPRADSDAPLLGSPPTPILSRPAPRPCIIVAQGTSSTEQRQLTSLVLTVDIPSVFVKPSKDTVDGLQLWADDVSRLAENAFTSQPASADSSRDPSLIGSRFFSKSRRSASDSISTVSAQRSDATKETIIKVAIGGVAVSVDLPRGNSGGGSTRPFNLMASDVDVLLEVKPEGKEETVITVGIMDMNILETSYDGTILPLLCLTSPRDETNDTQALLKLRFTSFVVANTTAKESRIKLTLFGVTYTLYPDLQWISDLAEFAKAPPGVFESVVPSERTHLSLKVVDTSVRALCPKFPGAMVLHLGETDFSTTMIGNSPETSFRLAIQTLSLFLIDDIGSLHEDSSGRVLSRLSRTAGGIWKSLGYALITELSVFDLAFVNQTDVSPPAVKIVINRGSLRLHLCADTGTALGAFISDFMSLFAVRSDPSVEIPKRRREPTAIASPVSSSKDLLASLDEQAFLQRVPEVGPAPDMVEDDLPSNLEYLDDSFSATAGLKVLDDDESDEFYPQDPNSTGDQTGVIATYGGETIRLLDPEGLHPVQHYFDTLPPDSADESSQYGETVLKVRAHNVDVTVFLYDGYDWARTRRIIEEETREMKRKLARIRQLLASGQTPDPSVEETNTLLFNSVYIGLEHNVDELDRGALMEAIDQELSDDLETASQSSWQSFKPPQQRSPGGTEGHLKRSRRALTRSKGPNIEFRLQGLDAEADNYKADPSLASRILVTIRDAEILDHIKTSTWSKFLTSLRTDARGNVRETDSNMVRVELRKVYPVQGNTTEEARLRAKILPLRLHVDQDALDFMKKFFSFKDPDSLPAQPIDPADDFFFQQVEVFPVDIKLDYKPRRVDYRALRDGRTIELMNFFHFDGSKMTLRHITLTGITGWAKVGDLLNDLWTPDVKATQLVDVISGVSPIRSVVNVGSGVADLVLLPISQYKKDGRVLRGLQKGSTAFVKSTAIEAIKLGARLATGTQVILEQAEHVIGGQFHDPIMAEALSLPSGYRALGDEFDEDPESEEPISRYADQPANVKEGVVSAYHSLRRNFNSAAQTILAVPMEVYERSGNEGAVKAVVRAVPIAVLRPMIGASEAVSKTLLGLHNTLDPNVRAENEAKYKQR
ncbi:autophagy-related protein 2 [Phanerochaete sordida]|uniref:Autophagy-related protein 2 n=1 Tax=Phanerochaete sordida TaxID=48140 RepID=A0A9P3G190_9APHY|nr:autophagy-related protein 2 [Phanerochaete sordida]